MKLLHAEIYVQVYTECGSGLYVQAERSSDWHVGEVVDTVKRSQSGLLFALKLFG